MQQAASVLLAILAVGWIGCTGTVGEPEPGDDELLDGTAGAGAGPVVNGSGTGTGTASSGVGGNSSCGVFPAANWWNTDISAAPVDPMSDTYVASMGADQSAHPDFGSIYGIPYVVVDGSVAKTPVAFEYADESDPGPYPIPTAPPIEAGGDRHILMVHRDECRLYEIFAADLLADGWHGGSGAIFDLTAEGQQRPEGWTSADAAGLPIYPGLARYDEAVTGEIRHALRFTASTTQQGYVFPATHQAGDSADPSLPPLGLRMRLKADVDISQFPPQARAVAQALKTYGMFLADNGSDWFISGAPDPGWSDDELGAIKSLQGSDFEAIAAGPITNP